MSTLEQRAREWAAFRKARKGYLCDEDSFNAGYAAAVKEAAEIAKDKMLRGNTHPDTILETVAAIKSLAE